MDSDIIDMQNIHRRRWFFATFEILYDRNEIKRPLFYFFSPTVDDILNELCCWFY